jgi:capsular polysaccharide biosynthesis protein
MNTFLLPFCPWVITESFVYFPLSFDQQDYPRRSFDVRVSQHDVLDECIYFYHRHHANYFHLVVESSPHLLAFDRSIFPRCTIIHARDILMRTFKTLLWIFDIHPARLVELSRRIFVRMLHICTPWQLSCFRPAALLHCVQVILARLNITDVPPIKRVAYNRRQNVRSRHILNFAEMMAAIAVEVPDAKFEVIQRQSNHIDKQVAFYRKVKCILAVRGGILTNTIFMQPGAVVIEIQSLHCDPAFLNLARFAGLRIFETTFPIRLLHSPFPANISVVVQTVKLAVKYL